MNRHAFPWSAALALLLLPACGGGGGRGSGRDPVAQVVALTDLMGNRPTEPKPSPDKTRLARLQPGAGPGRRMNLFVGPSGGPAVQITHVEDRDLSRFHWLDNDRLAYYRVPEGDERQRLWVVNADGSGLRELTPPDQPQATTHLLGHEPGGTGFLRVAMGDYTRLDLYRIHPGTGECQFVERAPEFTNDLTMDPAGRILMVTTFDGRTTTLLHRNREDAPFRTIRTASYPDSLTPFNVLPGGRDALVRTNLEREFAVLRSIHLEDGTLGPVLQERPGRDVDDKDEDALGWFSTGLPGDPLSLRVDATTRPTVTEVVTCTGVTYPARDGLAIPAYLYLPKTQGMGRWPAVVLCHGGPIAQHQPGDAWACLLASRGLAVLCPDFRGSAGYGKSFTALGFGQWGGAMQDDLTDGARWLVQEGYAREDRIGIVGASYGGYAALAGAAFTPEVFRCAAAFCGPSNLLTFMDSCYTPAQANFMRLSIGDPVTQRAELAERSPALHADRIRIPMLIGHGGRDVRVSPAQSEEMVQALRARGVQVPYLTYPEEGHGFSKEENRLHYFRTLENFLALHLGSKVESPTPVRLTP